MSEHNQKSTNAKIAHPKRKISHLGIAILTLIVLLFVVTTIIYAMTPSNTIFNWFIRLFGLYGFIFLVIASIMSSFLVEINKIFGKPFLKLHHIAAALGLSLITLHPILLAIESNSLLIFLPNFESWFMFWVLAGRPSLIIIYLAFFGILFKKKLKYWRGTHALMYIALLMGYVHGMLIGTDFKNPVLLILFSILFALTVIAFVMRRYQLYVKSKQKKNKTA